MVAMRTTVAHSMPVANGMPLAAIGARGLWQGYSSLWLDSEDATYMVAIAAVC